ncbi:unnamed protein product [Hymenolepis diminuta]|uniref:DUF5741 domain-containing protein n=1 Tax=Hymenolepis diminuta TaxID=6216 RepID=A0A564YQV3_HYMDI|nr:unnamed protein product [Hymenolepis diminuta]
MAEGDSKNLDESVSFLVNPIRTEMLDDSFRNVKFVSDDSESLSRLRIDNFNLRLLCHKYEEVFNKGQVKNMGLRMYEAEQNIENLRHQLGNASEVISSLKYENEGLKRDNEEWSQKFESSDFEWRRKYDLLFFEFQELQSSQRKVENRCETVECESSRLENIKNAEIATLQQKLNSAGSQIAVLEAELAELRSKGNVSNFHDDKENSSVLNFSTLLDPLSSPIKNNNLTLQRRYSAAQEVLKSLRSNCDSLSTDLSICKQELSVSESKLRLILEQYEEEKSAHLKDLEQRDELERKLHDRIADLVSECHQTAERNDELSGKVKQLKESEARLREAHIIEVKKLNRLLVDRERALLELYTPDTPTETNGPHLDDTEPTAEVTQYHHELDSSIFNSIVDASVASAPRKEGTTQSEAMSVEMTKLQHEVALLRSKLVAQVKTNTRLKAAFNALSESNPPPLKAVATTNPANLSVLNNPCILEDTGNISQANDSFVCLLNSNKRVSQTLDKTLYELRSALSKVEAELSAGLLEVSQIGEEPKHKEDGVGLHDTTSASGMKSDRLRDVYSLIKGLVEQFDNLRTFRNSFHETVNRSVLATSLCLETSSRYAVPRADHQTSRQTSFVNSARRENRDPSALEPFEHERTEPAEKSVAEKGDDEELSVSQMSHNNTTFHLLREHFNDNTMEDLSMTNSMSFTASQRSHALDITGLEMHSQNIFDRVAHAVAGIQEALDAWSLDAATELLAAISVNADGISRPPISSHGVTEDAGANLDTLLNLVVRFVEVLSKTKSVEVAAESTAAFSDWCDLVHRWFELFIDTLQGRKDSANLTEVGSQLSLLELQFNEEFVMTAAVTQHPVTLSRQNATLQISDITEPPTVSLYENGDDASSRCEQLTSTIEKLKADLSLNVRELTDKEATVVDLESKVRDLETKLAEAFSIARTKESKIEALEAELPQMETKLQELELEWNEALSKAQVKEKRVEELETEVDESKTRLQRMDAQLAETLLSIRIKEAKVAEMEAVVKDKESKLATMKEQLAETETRLTQKEARVTELKVAANELRGIYDDLENQLNKANKDVEDWKAKSERLEDLLAESIERETGFSLQLRQALDEVSNLNEQRSALETQLKEKLEEHHAKMQSTRIKYESLLEVAKSRCAEMAEQCQRLQAERDNLCDDLEMSKEEKLMLQTDLTMARMVSADAQINLAVYLEDGPIGDKEDLEAIRQKARKYPQLKALAFSLKDKLERRAGLLHDSTKENTRLKMIVSDHEKRVKELVNELERLREQILVKNEAIKKLENLVRLSATDLPISTLSERPDEISPTENPRGASFRSPNLFNSAVTVDLVDGGILNNNLPEHLNGVNSLMADIGATVREISGCLEAVTAEGGRQHDDNTSASFAAQISSLSTDTPSSLTVSFGGTLSSPAQDVNTSSHLPDRLNHLVHKLSIFWSAMAQELQTLISTVQSTTANVGQCGCEDHLRARKLVRRSVEALGNLSSRYPENRLFTHVLAALNEALELLRRQSPSSSSSSSSLASSRGSLSSSRGQEQKEILGTAPPTTGTTSSCSCSCRRRCSRMAASVQELTNMLNTTATALTKGRAAAFDRGDIEQAYYTSQGSPEHSLSN